MVLATAALVAATFQAGDSSLALPPVTVIEIPGTDELDRDASTINDPQPDRPTTTPSSETTPPPDPEGTENGSGTNQETFTPDTLQPPALTPGTLQSPATLWSSARRAAIVALGGMVLTLGWVLYRLTHVVIVGPARSRRHPLRAGILKRRAEKYEAVQFVNRTALGPAVVEDRLGEFDHLDDAIAAARSAWTDFQPTPNRPEAWWVVRSPGSLRVDWIAESGSKEERMIDLRSTPGTRRATPLGNWKHHQD